MPPRDQELPEGTDQIINGAMETGAGAGASTGSSTDSGFGEGGLGGGGFGGTGSGGTTPGGSADFAGAGGTGAAGGSSFSGTGTGTTGSGGFIGSGGGSSDGTGGFASAGGGSVGYGSGADLGGGSAGGTSSTGGSGSSFGGGSDLGGGGSGGGFGGSGGGGMSSGGSGDGGSSGGGVKQQVKSQVQNLQGQATDKVRAYAEQGKERATTALDDLTQVVNEAAQSIDERLGPQYGDYARRAATAVSGFADTVRGKDVDELFDDARDVVRKSPGVAIGVAAVLGFTLVRLVKAGMPEQQSTGVDFQPDPQLSGGSSMSGGSGMSGGTTTDLGGGTTVTTGSQAPYVAPTTGA